MSNETKHKAIPRLRFPEFRDAGEWEVKRIKDIAEEILDGDWIESKHQSNSGVRLIQTGNIGIGKFIPKKNSERFVSTETFYALKCKEVFPGDCLVSRLPEPAGRSIIVPDIGQRMITAVDCTIIRFNATDILPYVLNMLTDRTLFLYDKLNQFWFNAQKDK